MRISPFFALALVTGFALSGCTAFGPGAGGLTGTSQAAADPAATTALALSATDIAAYADPGALSQLTEAERAEAASAQFYALQFGRPGAPRQWQGKSGASGQVSVGPYVQVNALTCRAFTHQITIEGRAYPFSGTACRDESGRWSVPEPDAA